MFYGPFSSWHNVKNPRSDLAAFIPAAVGDGIADDTAALQAALDFCGRPVTTPQAGIDPLVPSGWDYTVDPGWRSLPRGFPKTSVSTPGYPLDAPALYIQIYLPAGTYRITKSLWMFNRVWVTITGEDPRTTTILWDGVDWQGTTANFWGDIINDDLNQDDFDLILSDGAWSGATIRRLRLDGAGKARTCIKQAYSAVHGGSGPELCEYTDIWVENAAVGVKVGGPYGWHDATTPVYRGRYVNCIAYGHITTTYNSLEWNMFECLFLNCGYALRILYGSIHSYNSLFINSIYSDVANLNNNAPGAYRGNVSITTHDANTSLTEYGVRYFIAQPGNFVFQAPWTVQGNLVINAQDTPATYIQPSPRSYIDNAFYDADYLTGTQTPGNYPIYHGYETGNPADLVSGLAKEPLEVPMYLSGNVYNGLPLPQNPPAGPTPSVYLDETTPSTWVPPNSLDIDQNTIKQILQTTATSALIQSIIDRLPQPPPITSPSDSSIVLTDLSTGSPVDPAIQQWINGADPAKNNMLHVRPGDHYASGSHIIPGGIRFTLIGDGVYGTLIKQTVAAPLFTIGGSTQAVKFHMMNVAVRDELPYSSLYNATTGLIDIFSGDMAGARSYWTSPVGESDVYTLQNRTSRILISGFDKLRATIRAPQSLNAVDVEGTGIIHSNDSGTVFRCYGLAPLAGYGRPMFRVLNGGSAHIYDAYLESPPWPMDLRGCNGYFVNENSLRYALAGDAPHVNYFSNFTGHQLHLGLVQTHQRVEVDVPAAGSTTTVWGIAADYMVYQNDPSNTYYATQLFLDMDLPAAWTASSRIAAPLLFGLTAGEGATTPANLQLGGNQYLAVMLDVGAMTASTTLATAMTVDPNDTATNNPTGPWYDFVHVASSADFQGVGSGNGILVGGTEVMSVYPNGVYGDYWMVVRGTNGVIVPHAVGESVVFNPPVWISQLNNCLDFPITNPNFVVTPMMVDALRYRPFPEPAKITDPHVTDIIFTRTAVSSTRPYSIRIMKQ